MLHPAAYDVCEPCFAQHVGCKLELTAERQTPMSIIAPVATDNIVSTDYPSNNIMEEYQCVPSRRRFGYEDSMEFLMVHA